MENAMYDFSITRWVVSENLKMYLKDMNTA